MKEFTQKISMDCTQEQYQRYLRKELLKMGYKESPILCWENQHIIINSTGNPILGTIHKDNLSSPGYTYIGGFRASLFLALAAMNDGFVNSYGEYWVGADKLLLRCTGEEWGFQAGVHRKATVKEIMAYFSNSNLVTEASSIDWEQRRYELAKAAMQGIMSRKTIGELKKEGVICCVIIADEMIKQLRETE